MLLRQQGHLAEARQEFEEALRLDPNDYMSHGNLGFISMQQGDMVEAEKQLLKALQLNPDATLVCEGLADIEKCKKSAAAQPHR